MEGDKSFEYIFDKTSFDLYDWLKNLKTDESLGCGKKSRIKLRRNRNRTKLF